MFVARKPGLVLIMMKLIFVTTADFPLWIVKTKIQTIIAIFVTLSLHIVWIPTKITFATYVKNP